MNVTKEVLRELLMMHEVSDEFLEMASAFRWKDVTVEDALGFPFWKRLSKEKDRLGKAASKLN